MTTRPDLTEARERLERLLPDVLRYDPVSMPAFDQRIDALIEAVRAEAGVSMTLPGSDELARTFHEQYERLAPSFGYVTRRDSSVPWEDVPEPNRSLMVAVATEVLERWSALAALSAGSGSRVEGYEFCPLCGWSNPDDGKTLIAHLVASHTRPTPPPAVDGTRVERVPVFVPVDLTQLQDDGVLLAANELFFWPLGLALTWDRDESGKATNLHVREWQYDDGHHETIVDRRNDDVFKDRRRRFYAWLDARIESLPEDERDAAEEIRQMPDLFCGHPVGPFGHLDGCPDDE